jgi:hypothetical protein
MKIEIRLTKKTAPMLWYENFGGRRFAVRPRGEAFIVSEGPFEGNYIHRHDAVAVESVTIVLPLPPRVLSPNCPAGTRGGRFARAAASKKYKETARTAVLDQRIETGPWLRATVEAVFWHVSKRRRDDVNHLAMLKPAYDGVVVAGLLVDDDAAHLTTLPARFGVDRLTPRVELRFERVE